MWRSPSCVECLCVSQWRYAPPWGLAGRRFYRWEVMAFRDFLCYSVVPCTVCVPRWANYRLKMLLAKGRHAHYCSSEHGGPVGSYLCCFKKLFLPGPLCVCHQRCSNHRTFVLGGCPSPFLILPSPALQGSAETGMLGAIWAKEKLKLLLREMLSHWDGSGGNIRCGSGTSNCGEVTWYRCISEGIWNPHMPWWEVGGTHSQGTWVPGSCFDFDQVVVASWLPLLGTEMPAEICAVFWTCSGMDQS